MMQHKDRDKIFRRRYYAFGALWILVFIGMIIQSALTGTDPSPRWQLPNGSLIVGHGVHLLMYKDEASEMFQEQRDSFWGTNPVFAYLDDPLFVADQADRQGRCQAATRCKIRPKSYAEQRTFMDWR